MLIPWLGIVALVAVWQWFLFKQSRGRLWSPLWVAFSGTFAAGLFLVAGGVGYQLRKDVGVGWSDGVIWWEVWTGVAVALLAAYFWRQGLRAARS